MTRYVALAEVARPHGVRGELRLKIYNPDSDLLERQRRVRMVDKEGGARLVRIKSVRAVPGALLIRLDGVNDRDAAEALRGARFEVPRDALEPIDGADEFYDVDLIGARVVHEGKALGTVTDVAHYPTCDALVVQPEEGKRFEVPLMEAYVDSIENGVVELLTLEGIS